MMLHCIQLSNGQDQMNMAVVCWIDELKTHYIIG